MKNSVVEVSGRTGRLVSESARNRGSVRARRTT